MYYRLDSSKKNHSAQVVLIDFLNQITTYTYPAYITFDIDKNLTAEKSEWKTEKKYFQNWADEHNK